MRMDLNADVGESFGAWELGQDESLIPLVSSVNVACGFHAGDPRTIERTVARGRRPGEPAGTAGRAAPTRDLTADESAGAKERLLEQDEPG